MASYKEKLIQAGTIIIVASGIIALFWFSQRDVDVSQPDRQEEQIFESEVERRARLLLPQDHQQLTQERYEEMSRRATQLLALGSQARKTEKEKLQIHEALSFKGQ